MPENSWIRTGDVLGARLAGLSHGAGASMYGLYCKDGISNRDAVPCSMWNEVRRRA